MITCNTPPHRLTRECASGRPCCPPWPETHSAETDRDSLHVGQCVSVRHLPFHSQARVGTSAGPVSTGNIATTGRLPERLQCKGGHTPLNEPHLPQV